MPFRFCYHKHRRIDPMNTLLISTLAQLIVFHFAWVDCNSNDRIISGHDTPKERYPYIVSLRSIFSGRHACGGTLIAPDIVLTAAHCDFSTRVWIGLYSQLDETDNHEDIEIELQAQHPLRQSINAKDHDIRILKLKQNSTFPLIRLNKKSIIPQSGQIVTVAGWGRMEFNSGGADLLQHVNLTYPGFDYCNLDFIFTSDMLCAKGFNESGSCRGDSGGPLILPGYSPQQDIQIGVVSFSSTECVHPLFPNYFARISAMYPWIRRMVCTHSTDPPTPFQCNELGVLSSSTPVDAPLTEPPSFAVPLYETAPVLISLTLDRDPRDVSWRVESTGDIRDIMVEHPNGGYTGTYSTYFERVGVLKADTEYVFVFVDDCPGGLNGLIKIFLGDEPLPDKILASADLYDLGSFNTFELKFNTSLDSKAISPSLSPSISPSMHPTNPSISLSPSPNTTLIMLRMRTYHDSRTTGWRIETTSGEIIYEELSGFFRGHEPVYRRSLTVVDGEAYVFVITDSAGLGFDGEAILFIGNTMEERTMIAYYNGDHGLFSRYEVGFTATLASDPYQIWASPSPVIMANEPPASTMSAAPSGILVPVLVTVLTDQNPEETGWDIASIAGSVILEVAVGQYKQESFLYTHSLELSMTEYYILTIRDSVGNGMLGNILIFLGNTTDPRYLLATFNNSISFLETALTFQVALYDFNLGLPSAASMLTPPSALPIAITPSSLAPNAAVDPPSAPSTQVQNMSNTPEPSPPTSMPISGSSSGISSWKHNYSLIRFLAASFLAAIVG